MFDIVCVRSNICSLVCIVRVDEMPEWHLVYKDSIALYSSGCAMSFIIFLGSNTAAL